MVELLIQELDCGRNKVGPWGVHSDPQTYYYIHLSWRFCGSSWLINIFDRTDSSFFCFVLLFQRLLRLGINYAEGILFIMFSGKISWWWRRSFSIIIIYAPRSFSLSTKLSWQLNNWLIHIPCIYSILSVGRLSLKMETITFIGFWSTNHLFFVATISADLPMTVSLNLPLKLGCVWPRSW